ncbi:ribonuclease HII [Candidatus Pacearchaeota archaeon]|nr:ribonuclease HII [Candidatus Pacearchaeota archaeon]
MLELGIDDAGRGPVIGPMVLAGCLIDEKTARKFKKLGVRDSKQLTSKRREFLTQKIKEEVISFEIVLADADEINKKQDSGTNLNMLEAIKTAKIINKINKEISLKDKSEACKIKVVVDCPSTSIIKWRDFLMTKVKDLSNLDIVCEHKADKNHVSVSAASILAKSTREKEMDKLKKKYGEEIGSGYTSDPSTSKFLTKNVSKHKDSGIFRKNWITWKKAQAKSEQKKLDF